MTFKAVDNVLLQKSSSSTSGPPILPPKSAVVAPLVPPRSPVTPKPKLVVFPPNNGPTTPDKKDIGDNTGNDVVTDAADDALLPSHVMKTDESKQLRSAVDSTQSDV